MKKLRMAVLISAVAVFTAFPAFASPAHATHRCGIGDPTLDAICEYHPDGDYKTLLHFIICVVLPTC